VKSRIALVLFLTFATLVALSVPAIAQDKPRNLAGELTQKALKIRQEIRDFRKLNLIENKYVDGKLVEIYTVNQADVESLKGMLACYSSKARVEEFIAKGDFLSESETNHLKGKIAELRKTLRELELELPLTGTPVTLAQFQELFFWAYNSYLHVFIYHGTESLCRSGQNENGQVWVRQQDLRFY
jgi:hypothetical protein